MPGTLLDNGIRLVMGVDDMRRVTTISINTIRQTTIDAIRYDNKEW